VEIFQEPPLIEKSISPETNLTGVEEFADAEKPEEAEEIPGISLFIALLKKRAREVGTETHEGERA